MLLLVAALSMPLKSMPLNPDVRQDTIGKTICVPGYTASVRPAPSYTGRIKARALREAGLPREDARRYELDHVVPLTLGGSPRSPDNLRLQPWPEARVKDRIEVRLSRMVCRRQMQLEDAQRCIWQDWRACK